MAIKQRKQLTGTTAQINAYAGVEGQLVWDKTKKKWVGMSGTAGTNYPMASESHTHSISNVTNLQSTLDGKQPKGSYATTTALTDGLAGKANKAHTHAVADVTGLQTTLDGKANKTHTHSIPNVTGLQEALEGKQPVGDYATTMALTTGLNGKLGKTEKANSAKVADTANSVAWSNVTGRPSIPSSPDAYVTKSWKSDTNWYKKWSNGLIEQGGYIEVVSGSSDNVTVSLPIPFSNTIYFAWYDLSVEKPHIRRKEVSTVYFHKGDIYNSRFSWYACGF